MNTHFITRLLYRLKLEAYTISDLLKMEAFRVAEGIRWTEEGTHSIHSILQGTVAIVFGVAITLNPIVGRWIGAIGIFTGAITIAAGVEIAYIGFESFNTGLAAISRIIYYIFWIGILGAFMWKKSMPKTAERAEHKKVV